MSDALNDISRDGAIYGKVGLILFKWLDGEEYEELIKELHQMPKGYFCGSGCDIAERLLEDMKTATTQEQRKKVVKMWGYDMREKK